MDVDFGITAYASNQSYLSPSVLLVVTITSWDTVGRKDTVDFLLSTEQFYMHTYKLLSFPWEDEIL